MMLPSSSLKLHLSKMNMFGIGNRMMRRIMKRKGIDSLETLRRGIHRLPDVDGGDGRPARRIAGQRDRRRCCHLHGACRESEREPIHLNPL